MVKLSLHLVTWNGARYIAPLFESLKKSYQLSAPPVRQAGISYQLFVLDNGSTDGTIESLKKELATLPFPHELIELKENVGFASGHNRLFRRSDADYILIVNQDMEFEPDCVRKLAQFLDAHPEAAAVAPRLMWLLPDTGPGSMDYGLKSVVIDSLGLKKYRTWQVADNGSGQSWKPSSIVHCPSSEEVFGVSGACAMFRRSALEAVKFPDGTIFDDSYGSYKEDADLAFRLSHIAYRSFVRLDAVAYHARGSGGGKKDQSFSIRYQSYRNHLATIFKNFSRRDILDFPFMICYEAGKFAWYLFMDPKVLAGWKALWSMRKELQEKRLYIQQSKRSKQGKLLA